MTNKKLKKKAQSTTPVDQATIDELERSLQGFGMAPEVIENTIAPLRQQLLQQEQQQTQLPAQPVQPVAPAAPGMVTPMGAAKQVNVLKQVGASKRVRPTVRVKAQRIPGGPAKGVTPSRGTLYDQVSGLAAHLESLKSAEEYTDVKTRFDTLVETITNTLESAYGEIGRIRDILEVESPDYQQETKDLDDVVAGLYKILYSADKYQSLSGLDDLGDSLAATGVDMGEISGTVSELHELANEVKQVGLDTHSGVTNPIDLGDWLF